MAKLSFYIKRIKSGRLKEMYFQLKWVYGYARKYWKSMIFFTLLGMVGTVVGLLTSFVSRDMVDIITGHQTGAVVATFCIMIGITISNTIITQISDYVSAKISMNVDAEIKRDIFSKILVTDWESLTGYHTGDLLTRWSSDASNVSSGVLGFIPNVVNCIFRFGSALVVMLMADWTFVLFAFASMPLSYLISRSMMSKMRENNVKTAKLSAKMSGFNQEAFSNIQTIKAFNLIPEYTKKLHKLQFEYISHKLKYQRAFIGIGIANVVLGLLVSYASYGWGIYRVWSGAITYGSMTMFLGLSGSLTGTLHNLYSIIPATISLSISAGRLMDIVEMPREDYSNEDEVEEFYKKYRDVGITLNIENVGYTYKTGTEVFKDASIVAKPHEVVALVGPSGEGKTTMLRVILALVLAQEGNAYLTPGNDESEKIQLNAAARRLFSYVPQGNTMFSGTIKSNMLEVKPDATDEEIQKALELACAWDFVAKLPAGIDSEIKERGGGFSEGQAQRLSIARAILRKSPLLLLDEATSALDVATERKVLKNIMNDDYPRTCIVTTHRPTVLNACNRVYAIRNKGCDVLNEEEIDELIRGF